MKLKILADENISRHLVNLVREQGDHVFWIREHERGIREKRRDVLFASCGLKITSGGSEPVLFCEKDNRIRVSLLLQGVMW
jgi:hypothetical protein